MTETRDAFELPRVTYDELDMSKDRGAGWAKLRELGPVAFGDGWYYLSRREDVVAALRDSDTYSSSRSFDGKARDDAAVITGSGRRNH
jgi:cytochrome P450